MTKNELLKAHGFYKTFHHWPVNDDWKQELHNYIIHGFHPGSFHRALFRNDLYGASIHTHVANKWSHIVEFMKWLGENAPRECWGDMETVESWLRLSKEQREKILFKKGYIVTDEEVTFMILETQNAS